MSEDAAAEITKLRAELEELRAERDGLAGALRTEFDAWDRLAAQKEAEIHHLKRELEGTAGLKRELEEAKKLARANYLRAEQLAMFRAQDRAKAKK